MPRESGAFSIRCLQHRLPAFSNPDFSGKREGAVWLDSLLAGGDDKLIRPPYGAGSTGVGRGTTKRICDLGPWQSRTFAVNGAQAHALMSTLIEACASFN